MNHSRREFLRAGCGFALAAQQRPGRDPVLGLILPTGSAVPAEALAMYPARIRFVTEALSKPGDGPVVGTLATYERLQDRIVPAARALVDEGADAILLLGTSVTFYKGAAHNQRLIDSMQTATKRPATTMSSAIVEAIRAAGGKRLAVATGYTEEVNGLFRVFLEESGFDVVALRGLGLLTPPDGLSRDDLETFIVDCSRCAQRRCRRRRVCEHTNVGVDRSVGEALQTSRDFCATSCVLGRCAPVRSHGECRRLWNSAFEDSRCIVNTSVAETYCERPSASTRRSLSRIPVN